MDNYHAREEIMNEIYLSSAVLPVICGCGALTANEPFYHADRTLSFNVLVYVTEGCIYVTEEETDYELKAGDLFFLKSGLRHYGKYPCPRGTCWYYVHFALSGQEKLPHFEFNRPSQYEPLEYSAPLPKLSKISERSETARGLRELTARFSDGDKMSGWLLNSEFYALLSPLCFSGALSCPPTTADRVEEYLRAHCREGFSASLLERELHLSYKRLAAVFKAEKGVTMQRYHNRCRMEEAARLLRNTLMSVGEIAGELGFEDMLYFSRRFRAYYSQSPTSYRKSSLNPPIPKGIR